MRKRKKSLLGMTLLFLCLTVNSGCAAKTEDVTAAETEVEKEETAEEETTQEETVQEETEQTETSQTEINQTEVNQVKPEEDYILLQLQKEIREADALAGIAFIGYIDETLSYQDTVTYLSWDSILNDYPFLINSTVLAYEGCEMFALVPASDEGQITVYQTGLDENGEYDEMKTQVLYKGEAGESIVLRCNDNENYSNVKVVIQDGNESVTLRPMISLQDGWNIVPEEGSYNFSPENIRRHAEDCYQLLPYAFPEIAAALEQGASLVSDSDFYFCNQWMLRFDLIPADASEEVKKYAVSFDATYEWDNEKQVWYVLGTGWRYTQFDKEYQETIRSR